MKKLSVAMLLGFIFILLACQKNTTEQIGDDGDLIAAHNSLALQMLLASDTMVQTNPNYAFWAEIKADKTQGKNSDSAIRVAKSQGKKINIFLGNSLLNQWTGIQDSFPGKAVFNRAFGGAFAEHFQYYYEDLGIRYADNLLIYVGENEHLTGWRVAQVPDRLKNAINYWKSVNPALKVVYIKMQVCPSLWITAQGGNWNIDGQNNAMVAFGSGKTWYSVCEMNVPMRNWNPRSPKTDCFKQETKPDGTFQWVHMNAKGYGIWKTVLAPYVIQ